jgi:hypothetical protein
MPWKERSVMDERIRFIVRLNDGESMASLCRIDAFIPVIAGYSKNIVCFCVLRSSLKCQFPPDLVSHA